jgi:hypothetical protein
MHDHEHIRHDDKATSRLSPKGNDGRFDFSVAMNGRDMRSDEGKMARSHEPIEPMTLETWVRPKLHQPHHPLDAEPGENSQNDIASKNGRNEKTPT